MGVIFDNSDTVRARSPPLSPDRAWLLMRLLVPNAGGQTASTWIVLERLSF